MRSYSGCVLFSLFSQADLMEVHQPGFLPKMIQLKSILHYFVR